MFAITTPLWKWCDSISPVLRATALHPPSTRLVLALYNFRLELCSWSWRCKQLHMCFGHILVLSRGNIKWNMFAISNSEKTLHCPLFIITAWPQTDRFISSGPWKLDERKLHTKKQKMQSSMSVSNPKNPSINDTVTTVTKQNEQAREAFLYKQRTQQKCDTNEPPCTKNGLKPSN